jgi:O-antigen ligase
MGGLAQCVFTVLVFAALQRQSGGRRAALLAGAVVVILLFVLDPFGISRVSELSSTDLSAAQTGETSNSFDWRFFNWAVFMDLWKENPLLGFGAGSTAELLKPIGRSPHSAYVSMLVETGVLGTVLFAVAYVVLIERLVQQTRASEPVTRSFAVTALAIVAGISVHGLVTDSLTDTAPMYLAAAIIGKTLTLPRAVEHRELELAPQLGTSRSVSPMIERGQAPVPSRFRS